MQTRTLAVPAYPLNLLKVPLDTAMDEGVRLLASAETQVEHDRAFELFDMVACVTTDRLAHWLKGVRS